MRKLGALSILATGLVCGQVTAPNPTQRVRAVDTGQPMPIYRVTVVARTLPAINYHHRRSSTMVDFRGTELMPQARGEAKVESNVGSTRIDTKVRGLVPPNKFGPEYLTYVMWAITPEGRATNLGEIYLGKSSDDDAKLLSTTDLQAFGLMITAEPYFAVTQPSDVVVMENVIRKDTTGTIEQVNAKYDLLQRGQYILNVNPTQVAIIRRDDRVPLQLQEARNAVQIARWTGAERYAADTLVKAQQGLTNAEGYYRSKGNTKSLETVAREAAQMAEDARIITLRKMEEERLAQERQASADREAKANADADSARRMREKAEAEQQVEAARRRQAEVERTAAERARLESEAARAAAQADAERVKREAEATRQASIAEAERVKREAEAARQATLAEADRVKREAEAAQAAAKADADRARAEAETANRLREQADRERAELRQRLLHQLNIILETRDTARGLIVNMSDVLFDTARWTLRPGAREKLAKIAGIVLAHPGLKLEVEGHTDSVGGDDYNQRLSEQRASSVRDYLVQQGVSSPSITAKGFGEVRPVATNDHAAGRQQNRRVELVVSGDIIGAER